MTEVARKVMFKKSDRVWEGRSLVWMDGSNQTDLLGVSDQKTPMCRLEGMDKQLEDLLE